MTPELSSFLPALPEIILAIGAMVLLMFGVYRGGRSFETVSLGTVVLLLAVMGLVTAWGGGSIDAFAGMFIMDSFAVVMKVLILAGAAAAVVMSVPYMKSERLTRFEYPILLALSALGMLIMVSAGDLIALYVGLEMQSLALYVLASFSRDSVRSTEAGLKYFMLGALSSGLLLYGASLVYGFTGSTNFAAIASALGQSGDASLGVVFGIVFVLAGLAFKVSAVPFHMWTPDVYEGAPTPVTAFFAVAPKVAAMGLFLRVMMDPFAGLVDEWRQIVVFISIASMVLGAFAAIAQTNIKRLMAYSSIGHIGYALIGLAAGTEEGIQSVIVYMAIYAVMNLGTFVVILAMRRTEGMVESVYDLAGLAKSRPGLAFAMAVFMFSLAGIPPLAGFFGKFYIFIAAIDAGLYTLAVIGVVTSVVGAYYYLRVIKVMYFDEPAPAFEAALDTGTHAILVATTGAVLLFFMAPGPLLAIAQVAARSLFR